MTRLPKEASWVEICSGVCMYATSKPAGGELHLAYSRIRPELLRFARARSGDDAEAEDIVQDVWLRIETREPLPVDNPRSYLFQMTNNIVIDRQRQHRRRQVRDQRWRDCETDFLAPGLEMCDRHCDIEASVIERQEASLLHDAIARLPKGARQVLYFHKIKGLSHTEVAMRLNITRSAVEKHMAVAMRHLRRTFIAS